MIIDKPILNRGTPEENLAIVDRWIADTADKLNMLISKIEEERRENGNN